MWSEVIPIYVKAFRAIWWTCLGISLTSFFAVGLERSVKLRDQLETEYGMDMKSEKDGEAGSPNQEKPASVQEVES